MLVVSSYPQMHIWRRIAISSGQWLSFCSDGSTWNFSTALE